MQNDTRIYIYMRLDQSRLHDYPSKIESVLKLFNYLSRSIFRSYFRLNPKEHLLANEINNSKFYLFLYNNYFHSEYSNFFSSDENFLKLEINDQCIVV